MAVFKNIESEKVLEAKLSREVRKVGGWSLKLFSIYVDGLPDRLCLFPKGRMFFVEMKTTNQKPTKIQQHVHTKLRSLGFKVYVIDSSQGIKDVLSEYK